MFDFVRALMSRDPVRAAERYIRTQIEKDGLDPNALPKALLRDLAERAYEDSKGMADTRNTAWSEGEFTQQLDQGSSAIINVLRNKPINADDSLVEILIWHRIEFTLSKSKAR
jgi:hypothetical protein